MTNSIHLVYDEDGYEAQLTEGTLHSVWRTDNNDSHNPPKFVSWHSLPIDLQAKIEHAAIKKYGVFITNGH
jgi:hypothetical protein